MDDEQSKLMIKARIVEARQTIIVKCEVEDKRISRVSFFPCFINGGGQPEPLKNGTPCGCMITSGVVAAAADRKAS